MEEKKFNDDNLFGKVDRNYYKLDRLNKEINKSKLMNWIMFSVSVISLILAVIAIVI